MFLKNLNRARKTLTFRLVFWYSGIFILSTSFIFILAYVLLSSSTRRHDRDDIRQQLGEYAARYRAGGLEALVGEITLEKKSSKGTPFFVRIVGSRNHTVYVANPEQWANYDLTRLEREATTAAGPGEHWLSLPSRDGESDLEIQSAPQGDGILLQVGKTTEDREELLESFREIFTGIMIPVILLGILSGSFLAFRTLRPVRSLISTIRSISAGTMNARVPTRQTGDELDELVVLFNDMLVKIETLIKGMRGSLDNVAHDLRTPMTRLRGAAEMALRSDQSPEAYREALADCVEEADRILTMLNTLMDISEAETGAMKLNLESVNITSVAEDAVDLYHDAAEEKKVVIDINSPKDLFLIADRNRMRQVLANLLDNAVKYTPPGGRVELEAYERDHHAVIVVRDSGIGIPPEEIHKIWDRLYRGDESRSQRGLGLGLSLVKAVTQAHRGRIDVSSAPGSGSVFTLLLPITPAHTAQLIP